MRPGTAMTGDLETAGAVVIVFAWCIGGWAVPVLLPMAAAAGIRVIRRRLGRKAKP